MSTIPFFILVFGLSAGAGKLIGGICSDRFGRIPTVTIATAFSFLYFAFNAPALTVLGIFALQTSTPIVLSAAIQRVPKYAATLAGLLLGFGLALAGIAFHFLS